MKLCVKRCGFKTGYIDVAEKHIPKNSFGTGEFPLDADDMKLLQAWPGEIVFKNGDNTPIPVGFKPASWDDPMIRILCEAGFAATIDTWCPFRPALSAPPAHLAPFYRQIGLVMEDNGLCYRRDFITRRAKYDGRERLWPQEGFSVIDYFDRPTVVTEHKR